MHAGAAHFIEIGTARYRCRHIIGVYTPTKNIAWRGGPAFDMVEKRKGDMMNSKALLLVVLLPKANKPRHGSCPPERLASS
jgi:hypothetical protein